MPPCISPTFLHTRYFRRVEGKLSAILSSKKLVGDGAAMNWRCTSGETPRYWISLPSLNSISSSCALESYPAERILLELTRLRSMLWCPSYPVIPRFYGLRQIVGRELCGNFRIAQDAVYFNIDFLNEVLGRPSG